MGAVALTCLPLLASVTDARAEPLPTRAERIFTPGRNAASEDTTEAVVLNPANLGFLPGWEVRYTGVYCPDSAKKIGCGHAATVGLPLLWDIGTALRFDYVQPPWGTTGEGAAFPYRGFDYSWLTWGLGLSVADHLAFGASIQRSYSTNAYLNGLFGVTAGLTYRPSNYMSFAAVAHDFNGPSTTIIPQSGLPVLDQSYVLAAAIRPTGRRELEVGLEVKYLQGSDSWLPRATASFDVTRYFRVLAEGQATHLTSNDRRGVAATLGIEVALDPSLIYLSTAGLGMLVGDGFGNVSTAGVYGTASIAGYRTPGVPHRARAVSIRLEDTPGTRGHVALLRKLWAIADDREIAALSLVLRAEPASSFARAEEIADALRLIRARGKKVLCSWEDNGARSLYVCANADKTVVNPAGGLRYSGLKAQYMYLAGLLHKLGVKAEFVRIGAHKTAPEEFMNERASDTARADHEDLLRQVEAVFVRNLSLYRKLPEDRIRAATAKGPFVAEEARQAGFVDGFAFDDEVERATQDLVGYPIRYEKYEKDAETSDRFGPTSKIALLHVDGDIVDGRSQTIPILDTKMVGSYTITDVVKGLKDDPTVRAVVLRIDSPGGSSMASDVMWRELTLLAARKPLIVSMGSIAASGGYYIATAGTKVFALPLTITGSIGIFYGKADVSQLLKNIGVNVETYKTTSRADAESLYRGFTADERVELERKVGQFYDVFLDRVSKGRHMSKQDVDAVGQGRVWTGQQAFDRHLVDAIGGLRNALAEARRAGGLPYDAPIVEYPSVEASLFDKALRLAGLHAQSFMLGGLPVPFREILRAVAPMAMYGDGTPLARLDWAEIDPDRKAGDTSQP